MATCPTCHQPATTRDGFDRRGRQRFACHLCNREFTHASSGAFSGYRWPPEVIVTAVRWYLSYPLSARQVTELLGERGIDVSARTVLTWTQTFGPQLATAARRASSSAWPPLVRRRGLPLPWHRQAVPLPRRR